MKRALLATAALSTVFIGNSSFAADLGARFRAPPVAPVPLFTWTGCYIGGHLGGGWGQKTVSVPNLAPGVSVTGDTSGFLGGGIEWAFWSNWSAKAEYDYYDFGTRTITLTGTFAGTPIQVPGVNVRQRISVGKFGINYRF